MNPVVDVGTRCHDGSYANPHQRHAKESDCPLTTSREPVMSTARGQLLAVYCITATFFPLALHWPLSPLGITIQTILGAAGVLLFALLAYGDPDSAIDRALVYLSAVVLTQGEGITAAIVILNVGDDSPGPIPTVLDNAMALGCALISVAAFFTVRAWTKQRAHQPHWPTEPKNRSSWESALAFWAAVGAVTVSSVIAGTLRDMMLAAANSDLNNHAHPAGGTTNDWLAMTFNGAIAGAHEEPVYVGLALLLWPYRGKILPLLPVVAASSCARGLLHVYYAAGQPNVGAALLAVLLWCAVWSTVNLAIVYRTRCLAAVIIGHGLWNIRVTNNHGPWDIHGFLPWALWGFEQITTELLIPAAFAGYLALVMRRRSQLRQKPYLDAAAKDPVLLAFAKIRDQLGVTDKDICKAAAIRYRNYNAWKYSKPLSLRPRATQPQRFWLLVDTVEHLQTIVDSPLDAWIAADPHRLKTLRAGQFQNLLALAATARPATPDSMPLAPAT